MGKHSAASTKTRNAILGIVRAASVQQKLSTKASILASLDIDDTRENQRLVANVVRYLATQKLIQTHLIGSDIAYSTK